MSDIYIMDGHKLIWHPDRVNAWMRGEPIVPLHIDAGLSKGCNIKCQYCYGVTQGNFYKKGAGRYFPRAPLLRYMRDAGNAGVRSIAFIGEAEPLMNPYVYEAIMEGKRAGIDIALGTNGILLDEGAGGRTALEHLSWIRFNISAASADAYRLIHASTEFAAALRKITFCVRTKKAHNLAVTVGLQMVLTPDNVDQVMPLASLGGELGVDYLVIKQCSDTIENAIGIYKRLGEYAGYRDILEAAEKMSGPGYRVIVKWNKITNEGARSYDRCLGVPFLLYTSGDGRVYPCGAFFNHKEEEYRMGDLTKQSFNEIIESARYRDVVEKVSRIDVHKECYANCRTHYINEFVWKLKNPPAHVNFV